MRIIGQPIAMLKAYKIGEKSDIKLVINDDDKDMQHSTLQI